MSSQWTSKLAIIKDLSIAQGRKVPVEVEGTLTGQKPQVWNLENGTDEDYSKKYTAEINSSGPDLSLIKQFLEMVNEVDIESNAECVEDVITSDPLPTTNLGHLNQISDKGSSEVIKVKRERNVAMSSLLKREQKAKIIEEARDIELVTKGIQNVSSGKIAAISNLNGSINGERIIIPMVDVKPQYMFRKKPSGVNSIMIERNDEIKKIEAISVQSTNEYTPSKHADEYYKKYEEQSKDHPTKLDMWTKLEKQLKELDAKKKMVARDLVNLQSHDV